MKFASLQKHSLHPLKSCPLKDIDVVTLSDACQDVWIMADRL